MKNRNRILAVLLIVTAVICTTGFTANASAVITAFEGYNVTVLDKAAPAVNMRGRVNDRNTMCFVSADGREIGSVSYRDYSAIIANNKTVVQVAGGGTLAVPPDGWDNWHEWFADEFNKLRGLTASRVEAAQSRKTQTIEEYRQEIIRLVNAEREKAGLPALYADEKAMEYAQIRAQEITVSYSHTRPNGLQKPYDEIGALNENIAGGGIPDAVMKAWMNSPGHRGNILNKEAFAIGVGCYWTGASYFWTQEFLW
jgi:hypothetical protein